MKISKNFRQFIQQHKCHMSHLKVHVFAINFKIMKKKQIHLNNYNSIVYLEGILYILRIPPKKNGENLITNFFLTWLCQHNMGYERTKVLGHFSSWSASFIIKISLHYKRCQHITSTFCLKCSHNSEFDHLSTSL